MNINRFFVDLRGALQAFGLVRIALFLILILFCAIGLSAALIYFFPEATQVKPFARYGYFGVFLITLVSSCTVIFPVPGIVAVLSLISLLDLNPAWAAVIAGIGGTLGEITAYYIGYGGRAIITPEHSEPYKLAEHWMRRYGGFAIFLFSLLPILLFDLVGLAAGALKFPIGRFLLFCFAGRLPRSFVEIYFYTSIYEAVISRLPEWMVPH